MDASKQVQEDAGMLAGCGGMRGAGLAEQELDEELEEELESSARLRAFCWWHVALGLGFCKARVRELGAG